jgi:hypothetical protein
LRAIVSSNVTPTAHPNSRSDNAAQTAALARSVLPKASTAGSATKSHTLARAASTTFTNVIQGADAATMVTVRVVLNRALLAGKWRVMVGMKLLDISHISG